MGTYLRLGRIGSLDLTARTSALLGSALLFVVLFLLGLSVAGQSLAGAFVLALIATLLHWVAVILHQFGHALAARRTGYPMTGIELWWVLSGSIYPANEPPLPASVHIQRALGGPLASLVVSLAAVVITTLLPAGKATWWLGFFFLLDNFLTFTLGSLLPLGFTDGSTLLKWLGDK
jgi:Zn-dependent protease